MDYVLTRGYLKPSQRKTFDKVFRKEAQENFIKLCIKHSICPICGGELFTLKINYDSTRVYSCEDCNYILK